MVRHYLKSVIVLSLLIGSVKLEKYLPILLWHSAGESCCGREMSLYTSFIKSQLDNDVYIRSVALDGNPSIDSIKSLTIHPFDQIKTVCAVIQSDPKLINGYNAIGLSQGGLFLRGLAQTCPFPPMRNLISLGGPQQGVHQFPTCRERFGSLCGIIQSAGDSLGYMWPFQQTVAPLTYWHDTNTQRYVTGSTFLAVINNERDYNANYVMNLHNLKRMILVKYQHDQAIVPNESAWFGYYTANGVQYPMELSDVYQRDKLGLEALKESGRLVLLLAPGEHLQLTPIWFAQVIIPYLMEE